MTRHLSHAGWSRAGLIGLALLTTGLLLTGLVMHHWADISPMDLDEWENRLRRAATAGHGTLAWVACLLAGRWAWPHIGNMWRRRSRRGAWWLGLLTLGTSASLAIAGLLLLYGPAGWHDAASASHWWFGLTWPALGLAHARRGSRRGGRD